MHGIFKAKTKEKKIQLTNRSISSIISSSKSAKASIQQSFRYLQSTHMDHAIETVPGTGPDEATVWLIARYVYCIIIDKFIIV